MTGLGLGESPLDLPLGPYYPATSVGRPYCRDVVPEARHRSFLLRCAAAEGAEGVGAREPHVAPRSGSLGSASQDGQATPLGICQAPGVLKPPGTHDSRLGTAGPGDRSRRGAETMRCSHEGAAPTRPLSLGPGTVAIPEGQSPGQPPA